MALHPTDALRFVIIGLYSITLTIAAVSDIKARRIPNWTVVAVIVLFCVWASLGPWRIAASGLEAAAIALIVGIALYAFGFAGAGDSKLFAAAALFAGLDFLPAFIVATSFAGGVLALISLAANPTRALVMFQMRGKGDFGPGIPYGVAIAVGGILVVVGASTGALPHSNFFGA